MKREAGRFYCDVCNKPAPTLSDGFKIPEGWFDAKVRIKSIDSFWHSTTMLVCSSRCEQLVQLTKSYEITW